MINQDRFEQVEFEILKSCPYCHSKEIKVLYRAKDRLTNLPGEFYLSKCQNCNLVFQNPRVKEEYIKLYYSDKLGYYNPPKQKNNKQSTFRKFKKFLSNQVLINHFDYSNLGEKNVFFWLITLPFRGELKIQSFPIYKNKGRLLEIGCSHGAFLEKMKELGWQQVQGIEMDKKTAQYAREKRNLNVLTNKIEECSFKDNEFDVVILNMVLEHLYSPFELLKVITKWIKPEGALIFSIPYFEGLEFRWFKNYAYGLHMPNHITFLNKEIIKKYLQKLGYKKIKFYFQHFDRDVVASAHYKYQDTKNYFYKILAYNRFVRRFLVKPFVFLMSILGKTSRVTVYANKI